MGAALISGFQEMCFLTRQKKGQISRTFGMDHRAAGEAEGALIATRSENTLMLALVHAGGEIAPWSQILRHATAAAA